MQEAMLFQALYDESSSAHFEQSFYHISGRLNVSIFEEAWNEVVRRHDILRTIFVHKDVPQPLQIVLKKRRISVCFKDIRSLSLEEQEAYCLEYRKKDWQQPFDLARDVLMRFALFQLDKESFNVVWSFHHILMDGWSGSVIHDEFYRIFRALAEGNRPALDQPVPFSLYIRWLKERDREGSGSYWREYLEGYNRPAGLALQKSDFSTPLQKEYDVGTLVSEFDETLTSALQNLASRNHVALNTIIQVMWGILLGKYNDLGDVVFGAVVSGRPAEINGIENMVGLLINLIPVRIRVKDSKTFRELALKVHEDSIRSKDHHYYPLAEIQAQTTLKQNLLDHVLVFENYPAETVLSQFQEKSEPDFVIDSFEHADHTNYDLNIQIAPEGGKLHFHIIYNCSVYDPGVIKNIGYHLEKIAKAVTENDEAEIEHIEVLLPGEKQEYLDARAEKDRTIHLYENLAEKTCTPGEYVPPENEQQEKLIEIWKEILATDSIGIDDNYIELGGHSIAAIQIVSRIHKILDVEIGLKEFFDNPSIKALDKIIQKRDLAEYEDIAPLAEQEHYEVSHSQGRLWILDKMEENFTAYNMSGAYMLEGPLNTQAFRRAFKIVEDRHESLRTTFTNLEGKPRQKIHKTTDFEVEEIDLTDKENNEHIAKKLAIEDANRLFDLETGPLLRVKLLKLSQDRYILVLTMHHIICDGWSFGVLENELLTLYNAFAQGRDPDLPCLKIQYKDYAFWQNRLLKGENIKAHQEYWQHKLSGELPALNMPTDYPRPAIQTYKGKTTRFFLDKTLTADLKKLAKENRASLFMTLLAAMKALLYRYTGQEDIIIGSPIAGRTHQDLEDQIGFYVNTLVLRDELMGDESFKTLLGKVRQTATEAYEHQIYPFDRLVEELDIQRDLSRSPIFDIMLVLQNNQKQEDLQDLKISWFEYETGISQFDLTFNFMEIGDELVLDINYRTDLFRDETIKRFENHFEELVKSIQKDENTLIKNINILSPEEKHRVLTEFNNTAADYPREKTIADLFEDQVKKTPENTALIFEEKHLTYRELDEQANEMAHFLRENYQVRQDDLVGVMAERNQGMIIALLGILKAGAAYLPIDPVYPRERIEYMTEDSGCKVVLEPTTGNQQPATSNLQPATSNQQPGLRNLYFRLYRKTQGSND